MMDKGKCIKKVTITEKEHAYRWRADFKQRLKPECLPRVIVIYVIIAVLTVILVSVFLIYLNTVRSISSRINQWDNKAYFLANLTQQEENQQTEKNFHSSHAHFFLQNRETGISKELLGWTETKPKRKTLTRNGGIAITESGLYHVYCHICQEATEEKFFKHTLFKRNQKNEEQQLASSVGTERVEIDQKMYYTSFIGLTLNLFEEEFLFLNVSDSKTIILNQNATYLGVYKI